MIDKGTTVLCETDTHVPTPPLIRDKAKSQMQKKLTFSHPHEQICKEKACALIKPTNLYIKLLYPSGRTP